jgi:formylglycine-generating enzyme required for sulfatase activity
MQFDDRVSLEDLLAESLADYQEQLAAERAQIIDHIPVPQELLNRFEQDRAFVQYLQEAWPRDHGPASANLSLSASDGEHDPDSREFPAKIGRFEIHAQLGYGGFGVVFLAFDPKLHRHVALKVPTPGTLLCPKLRQRFVREARLAAAMDHPNVVPVHEVGEAGPIIFIASAYCERGPLSSWIAQQQDGIPPRLSATIVAELSDAVQHAHDRGILHRDLKPSNVLLRDAPAQPSDSSGCGFTACLGDFGLSKIINDDLEDSRSGGPVGTPQYMSPEQANGRHEEISQATDVYGLGAILYELLTGVPPFEGTTRAETIQKVISDEPRPPHRVRRDVPRDLETICLACLQKLPARRYRSPGELARDLRCYITGHSISPPRATHLERALRWMRRGAWLVAAAIALAMLIPSSHFAWARFRRHTADGLLLQLISTDIEGVSKLGTQLDPFQEELADRLRQMARTADRSESGARAALVLLPRDETQVVGLRDRLLVCEPRELSVIRGALMLHQGAATRKNAEAFWETLQNDRSDPSKAIRAACALAAIDSQDPRWPRCGPKVSDLLLEKEASTDRIRAWASLLAPVRDHLRSWLETAMRDRTSLGRSEPAAIALAELESDRPMALADLALKADLPQQIKAFSARLSSATIDEEAVRLFEEQLGKPASSKSLADDQDDQDDLARRKANAAVCLVRLGRSESVWSTLESEPGPGFAAYLSERLSIARAPPLAVFNRIESAGSAARRALIIGLGGYSIGDLGPLGRDLMTRPLLELYRIDADAGVHAAIAWLLRGWGKGAEVERCDGELRSSEPRARMGWRHGAEGHTLAVIRGPVEFTSLWRDDFSGPAPAYSLESRTINYSFEIATTKVTVDQYRRFLEESKIGPQCYPRYLHGEYYVKKISPSGNCPINSVSFYAAARYCNWLSQKAGIPEEELCYQPTEPHPLGKVVIRANHLQKAGYRLPTDEERLFASMARTTARFYFGASFAALKDYEWFRDNSDRCTSPVGLLRPNPLGLHDTLGSLFEWTSSVASQKTDGRQLLRGMPFTAQSSDLKWWNVIRADPSYSNPVVGFRVARTVPGA